MPLGIAPLAVPLVSGLVRDRSEAEGLVHACAEADLFALLTERRSAAAEELRVVELASRILADLQAQVLKILFIVTWNSKYVTALTF